MQVWSSREGDSAIHFPKITAFGDLYVGIGHNLGPCADGVSVQASIDSKEQLHLLRVQKRSHLPHSGPNESARDLDGSVAKQMKG